jgi:hypothetical protein
MNSQRILKICAIVAVVATLAALVTWRSTDEPPPFWTQVIAITSGIAALVIALVSKHTRPRLMLRFLAALFALLAVIAFASDWTIARSDDGNIGWASLLDHLTTFTPSLIASIKSSISAFNAALWDPLLTSVLNLPAWLLFAILAVLSGYAGRPRHQVRIFIN